MSMNICDQVIKTILRSNFYMSLLAINSKNLVHDHIKVGISMEEYVHWGHF